MHVTVSMPAEVLFYIGGFGFTNTMLTTLIIMAFLVGIAWWTGRDLSINPDSRWQIFVEMIVDFLGGLSDVLGNKLSRRLFPIIATLFIFIIVSNWSGLLPFMGHALVIERAVTDHHEVEVEHEEVEHEAAEDVHVEEEHGNVEEIPVFRAPTSDFSTTVALALIAIAIVQFLGVQYNGVGGYLKHMADPPFLFPIHIISEISHVVSLAARLFGNIFGGEVLMAVIFAIAPWGIPAVFMGIETLFGFIQALVFSVLFIVYVALAAGHGLEAEQHSAS